MLAGASVCVSALYVRYNAKGGTCTLAGWRYPFQGCWTTKHAKQLLQDSTSEVIVTLNHFFMPPSQSHVKPLILIYYDSCKVSETKNSGLTLSLFFFFNFTLLKCCFLLLAWC